MKTVLLIPILLVAFAPVAVDQPIAPRAERGLSDLVITNAYDAFGEEREGLTHDFGFSSVVQYRGTTILFDAGTNAEIFQRNLEALQIDPEDIDLVIVSHGHDDHLGGLDYLLSINPNAKIYLPKDFFSFGAPVMFPFQGHEPDVAAQLPKSQRYYGGDRAVGEVVPSGRFWKARVEYVTEAKEVLPGVTLIPTTSALMGTFIKYPPFGEQPQFIGLPELSVSFATDKGEVLLAGCSHSTIEAIVQEAQKILGRSIHLVGGGFHLIPYDRPYLEALARRLRDDYGIESVAPAHCTGHLAFAIFRQVFGDQYRFFGLGESITV